MEVTSLRRKSSKLEYTLPIFLLTIAKERVDATWNTWEKSIPPNFTRTHARTHARTHTYIYIFGRHNIYCIHVYMSLKLIYVINKVNAVK